MAMSNELTVISGKKVYVTPTGLKITTRGKVVSTRDFVSSLVKSERRRIRKALRQLGHTRHIFESLS
jgi:hypothetical protein